MKDGDPACREQTIRRVSPTANGKQGRASWNLGGTGLMAKQGRGKSEQLLVRRPVSKMSPRFSAPECMSSALPSCQQGWELHPWQLWE